jgi:hypothetical protein
LSVCSFVGQLLYLFSELVSFAKETFVKLCRSEIFRQEVCLVDIFQIERNETRGDEFQLHNMGQEAEAKYAFVVSLASFLPIFFLIILQPDGLL